MIFSNFAINSYDKINEENSRTCKS